MVLRSFVLVILFGILLACGSNSNEQSSIETTVESQKPLSSDEAMNVYRLNCASCHGADGKLQASNAKDLSVSTLKTEEIEKIIQKGSDKGMMPFGEILTGPEIDGLVDYVQTLRK